MASTPGPAAAAPKRGPVAAGLRLIGLFGLALAGLAAIGLLVLDSPLGHRLVTDRIAALRLQSGLVISIGRIDGSLYGAAQLHNVVLGDAAGLADGVELHTHGFIAARGRVIPLHFVRGHIVGARFACELGLRCVDRRALRADRHAGET